MNLDLLIKLAKLANENSNENEANLVARKVCRMIKEANYKIGNSTYKEYDANDWMHDIFTYARQQAYKKPEASKPTTCVKCGADISKVSFHKCDYK